MTGNDIVDIAMAAAESNWKRKGFLEKIFTLQERQYVQEAPQPDKMVWTLWSMKESAYKIYTRQYGGRFFAPQKIQCTLLTPYSGQATINKIIYHTTTSITNNYIYSIARLIDFEVHPFINQCFYSGGGLYARQPKLTNERIISCYATVISKGKDNFSIIKDNNGVPTLFCKEEKISIPVSITHHGRYAAFTIN